VAEAATRIAIPDVVIALTETETTQLVDELDLTDRPDAPYDAGGAAAKLRAAGHEDVSFTDRESAAIVRALDNLRTRGRLRGREHEQSQRLRDAHTSPGIAYELLLVNDWANRHSFMSWSGPYAVGDRLCTGDADWRVYELDERDTSPTLLHCQPYDAEWPRT
jgi:hypothetical protein